MLVSTDENLKTYLAAITEQVQGALSLLPSPGLLAC